MLVSETARIIRERFFHFKWRYMNINKYETKDLALAAYLTAIGYTLRNHTKYNSETYFVFDQSQEIEDEAFKFISRQAMVEPVAFSQALRSLKSILYAIKSEDGNNNNGKRIR